MAFAVALVTVNAVNAVKFVARLAGGINIILLATRVALTFAISDVETTIIPHQDIIIKTWKVAIAVMFQSGWACSAGNKNVESSHRGNVSVRLGLLGRAKPDGAARLGTRASGSRGPAEGAELETRMKDANATTRNAS